MIELELQERDGTKVTTIKATRVSITAGRNQAITRTLTAEVELRHYQQVKVLGRRVVATDGDEKVFVGYMDGESCHLTKDGSAVTITARDNAKLFKDTTFETDTTYGDLTATETVRAISTVTASSAMTAGAPVQRYGTLYDWQYGAETAGSWVTYKRIYLPGAPIPDGAVNVHLHKEMDRASNLAHTYQYYDLWEAGTSSTLDKSQVEEAGSPILGDYSVKPIDSAIAAYSIQTFSVQFKVDLGVANVQQSLTVNTNGTVTILKTSSNGTTWADYAPNTEWRYCWVKVTKNAPDLLTILGVEVLGAAYAANNVKTDDTDSWRPAIADFDRWIKFDEGSSLSMNVLRLKWGVNDRDTTTKLSYKLEGSTDDSTYTQLATGSVLGGRFVEVLFTRGSYRYLRVTVTYASGPVALRFAQIVDVVSTATVDSVIGQILASEGVTDGVLVTTRVPVSVLICETGKEKLDSAQSLASQNGLELFWQRDGKPVLRWAGNLNTDSVKTFTDSDFLDFGIEHADNVRNKVIGIYSTNTTTLRSEASDQDDSSPTCFRRIGKRVAPPIYFNLADTQTKLDAATKAALLEATRRKAVVRFTVQSDSTLEVGDAIRIEETRTGTNGLFLVEGFTRDFSRQNAKDRMQVEASEV